MKHSGTHKITSTRWPLPRHWCIPARRMRSIAWLVLLCTLILLPRDIITPAQAGDRSSGRFYMTGQMWTRNLVRGPQGQPIFAEFASDGTPIKEIGEATGESLGRAFVMPAADYRLEFARYQQLKNQNGGADAKGHLILDRESYNSHQFQTLRPLPPSNQRLPIPKPSLQPGTRSVVVRGELNLLTVGTNPVLLESTINLNAVDMEVALNANYKSLLLDQTGKVLYKTVNNYGYRVSDIKQKSGESDPLCRPAYGIETDRKGYDSTTDALCGPVKGTQVGTQIFPGQYGGALTSDQGRWSVIYFKSPCPGFEMRYSSDFYQTLFYTNFNPKGSALGQFFRRTTSDDWCKGADETPPGMDLGGLMSQLAVTSIYNSTAEAPRYLTMYVDVAAITGVARVGNSLNQGDAIPSGTQATQYQTTLPAFTPKNAADAGLAFDLDGDGIPDPMDKEPKDYNQDNRVEEIGFYLNGKQPDQEDAQGNLIAPDVIRRMDTLPDFQHQGLLKHISQDDLKETDFYIYRVSNGQKIQERRGLNDVNIYKDGTSGLYYLSLLRGPKAREEDFYGTEFSAWQSQTGINPALHMTQADHLRVGEPLKLILVNRRTGYIGTALTQMPVITSGDINMPIPPIVMRPPNLKIKAQRQLKIDAGLNKDQERNLLIGFEGAGLKSDTYIQVTTDWFDHDGTPLPGDLPGYTGRLAKITGDKTLGNDDVTQFAIHPGSRQQLVKLTGQDLGAEHYYLHVNGEPSDGSPNFTTLGSAANDEILKKRPKHYVPVLVPIYDEAETLRRKNLWYYATQIDQQAGLPPPAPVYHWYYRPEMQFSVLELSINAADAPNETTLYADSKLKVNQCSAGSPEQIQQCIEGLKFSYWLKQNDKTPLDLFGPGIPEADQKTYGNKSELIFSIGAEEVIATVNQQGTAIFINADHLNSLMQEDYIVLSLYQNTDAANTLWELALPKIYLSVDANRDGKITPDLPAVRRVLNYTAAGDATKLHDLLRDNNIDVVSAEQPYVFWLNDDFDVVENYTTDDTGSSVLVTQMDPPWCTSGKHATCEQVDENNVIGKENENGHTSETNSDSAHRDKIESLADLEDFAPLELRIEPYRPDMKLKIKLRAVGLSATVFHGLWTDQDALNYLYEETQAKATVTVANSGSLESFPGKLDDTLTLGNDAAQTKLWDVPEALIKAGNGIVRLIFEGVNARAKELCDPHPEKCYLEAIIVTDVQGKEVQVAAERLQMVLQPIERLYEHHTVGDSATGFLSPPFTQIGPKRTEPKPLHTQVVQKEDRKDKTDPEYTLFVHGWRMQSWERRRFAETAYKRLYWLGYQGYFGLASWPTEWFNKPGYENITSQAVRAAFDSQNYDRSESVARRAGPYLADLMTKIKSDHPAGSFNIMAHSMGNIVVSEALRDAVVNGKAVQADTYIAMQSAEAAHAFDGDLDHVPVRTGTSVKGPLGITSDTSYTATAWRSSNPFGGRNDYKNWTHFYDDLLGRWVESPIEGSRYEIPVPPDRYRFGSHPSSEYEPDDEMANNLKGATHYYTNIKNKAKIVNFFNKDDYALSGWNYNQLQKPDRYTTYVKDVKVPNGYTPTDNNDAQIATWDVTHHYKIDNFILTNKATDTTLDENGNPVNPEAAYTGTQDVYWSAWGRPKTSATDPGVMGWPDILAFIIPARSTALGATAGVQGEVGVGDEIDMRNRPGIELTANGYDHSAQFVSDNTERWKIWWNVMFQSGVVQNRDESGKVTTP